MKRSSSDIWSRLKLAVSTALAGCLVAGLAGYHDDRVQVAASVLAALAGWVWGGYGSMEPEELGQWVLVPRELTPEMVGAWTQGKDSIEPGTWQRWGPTMAQEDWSRMIAAAPRRTP